VCALLLRPIVALTPVALDAITSELTAVHWAFAVGWVVFMAWSEGYRGFHTRFAPRAAARAGWLAQNPTPVRALLAPLVVMALFHVRRSTLIARVILLTCIVGAVVAVRLLPAPWRGLVDLGVIVGLGWGLLSVVGYGIAALRGNPPDFDLSLPGTPSPRRRGGSTEG